jgi:methanogenic corrinoid protein MtbC1
MDRMPLTGAGVNALSLFDDPESGREMAGRPGADGIPGLPAAGRGWLGSAVGPTAEERLARLVRTIEADIIPRLVQAHAHVPRRLPDGESDSAAGAAEGRLALDAVDPDLDAAAFAALVLTADDDTLFGAIDRLVTAGCTIESLYVDLLAPTARRLGTLWSEDRCNFADVTIAAGRLQQVLRRLSPAFGQAVQVPPDGRRVLLLPAPGEQHTLGLSMVADYFVRAGWLVIPGGALALDDAGGCRATVGESSCTDVLRCVQTEWFDVIGFSLGSLRGLGRLQRLIDRVRRASRNRAVGILVGGPVFGDDASLLARAGADATAVDGAEAPRVAERLLAERSRRLRHA